MAALSIGVLAATGLIASMAGEYNILSVGDEGAMQLGVAVERVKRRTFVVGALLVGLCVSAAGLIGFVGLIVPHLLRLLLGPDHRLLVPASLLFGATFLVLADVVSRVLDHAGGAPRRRHYRTDRRTVFLYLLRVRSSGGWVWLGRKIAGEGAPRLSVENVSVAYDDRSVLREVSVCVRAGEIVGVLGPNGAGKSTLVKVASKVLLGYDGRVCLEGRDIASMSRTALAQKLAVVPQEPAFGFPFSVAEVVMMGRHVHRRSRFFDSAEDRRLCDRALARCGALELRDRCIHELSAGERQRIVFARALAQAPEVLLLDEPASFLDIRHQVALYDLVRELCAVDNMAVLTVLHDLNLAAEYCDRIVLLRQGRVEASGATADVFTYQNLTRVFDTDVYVEQNAFTGRLIVIPLPGRVRRGLNGETKRHSTT